MGPMLPAPIPPPKKNSAYDRDYACILFELFFSLKY